MMNTSEDNDSDGVGDALERAPAETTLPKKPASDVLADLELPPLDGTAPRSRLPSSGMVRVGRLPR